MERLTKKDNFFDYVLPEQNIFGDNQAFEISLGKTEYTCKLHITGEAIKRFGELEDVLEKYGIENLDDFIKEYSSRNTRLANDNYDLEQELADLQHRLKVAERATKLACDELRVLNYRTFDNVDIDFEQQFKEQAEKELKGEE